MRVLLTGGFGYLGGRLAQDLHRAGAQVVLGSRKATASPAWLPGAETAVTDWGSHEALVSMCSGVDAIIHLAGMNAQDCARDPVGALQVNGLHTGRLVAVATEAKVPRFIYFSTAHVYAAPLAGAVDETTCPRNLHPYATSHRAGEDMVRAAKARGEIEGFVVRLSNGFGAPAHAGTDCWMLVANDLARQLAATGSFALHSAGTQLRDFVALGQVGRVVNDLLALPMERLTADVFNVGGGFSISILDMAHRIGRRYKAMTGRTPTLSVPAKPGVGEASRFTYGMDNLEQAGIALPSSDSVDVEIDMLLRFCFDTFG